MIALDTDVMTMVLHGHAPTVARLASIPTADQGVPVIVLGELLRGRLAAIRQTEAGKGSVTLPQAYELFARTVADASRYAVLPFTPGAESLFKQWKRAKVKVGTQDMQIAAICTDLGATLVTRNARDYAQIPGFTFDVWN
ncbi:MAG TPA: type II toxin-antitoxin system VapC family toxin [Gemmataceae bacterium]|nr:type II toxin-antitoxin system VapC family toxin [Gemmataceae bacterium]